MLALRGIVSFVVVLVGVAGAHVAVADTTCAAFRKEQRVDAKKDGGWVRSTVVRCDPRKGYLIHFDGYGSANDAWLPDADLRALAVAPAPTVPPALAGFVAVAPVGIDSFRRTADAPALPSLLVWGEHDDVIPRSQADVLAAQLPGSRLEVIPGASHAPYDDEPDAFADVLLPFLRTLTG